MAEEKKLILPFDDGEVVEDELEKEEEERDKEARKVLDDAAKEVDEINGKEHTEAFPEEPKMPKNEKLILKEPETSLNEELAYPDNANICYDIFDAIRGVISDYEREGKNPSAEDVRQAFQYFSQRYNFGNTEWDESLKEDYEYLFDRVLKLYDKDKTFRNKVDKWFKKNHPDIVDAESYIAKLDSHELLWMLTELGYNKIKNKFGISDESLDEALPKDLALAYKNAHSVGADRSRRGQRQDKERGYGRINQGKDTNAEYDFFNSDYREITPEEAIQLRKEGKVQNIRAIFDGQLVTFDEKGRQTSGTYSADRNGSLDDKWKSPNGNYIDRTNALSFNNVIQRADKIYYTEEKPYDYEKMRARKENPESRYGIKSFGSSDLVDYSSRSKSRVDDPSGDYNYGNYGNNQYLNAESEWKKYQEIINDPDSSDWEKERAKDQSRYYARRMDTYKDDRERYLRKEKDAKARRRYYTSEVELQKPFVELERLRSDLDSAQSSVNYAERNYRDMKKNGSPNVVTYKNKLIDAKKQLAEYKRKVAKYEVLLQDAEDENDAELQKAEQEVLKYQQQLEQTQSELDKLMRRG